MSVTLSPAFLAHQSATTVGFGKVLPTNGNVSDPTVKPVPKNIQKILKDAGLEPAQHYFEYNFDTEGNATPDLSPHNVVNKGKGIALEALENPSQHASHVTAYKFFDSEDAKVFLDYIQKEENFQLNAKGRLERSKSLANSQKLGDIELPGIPAFDKFKVTSTIFIPVSDQTLVLQYTKIDTSELSEKDRKALHFTLTT